MNITCRCGCDLDIRHVEIDGCYDMKVFVDCCANCDDEHQDNVDIAQDEANESEIELNDANNRIAELEARVMAPTYGNLFKYVGAMVQYNHGCDDTFRHSRAFAAANGLVEVDLVQQLQDWGGHCDCEVLMNAIRRVDRCKTIGDADTPRTRALLHGWYCHCQIEGEPASCAATSAARDHGVQTEFWIPCTADAPFAALDLNRGDNA